MSGRPISKRYRKFAPEYVSTGFNGTEAVIKLGWTRNRKSANVIAYRLLSNVHCRQLIEDHVMNAKMDADEVATEIASVARTKTPVDASAKMKALDLLTKINGMITQKIETIQPDIADTLLSRIKSSAQKSQIPESQAACKLFDSLQEWGSEHADPANFGPYAEIVANHAKAQQNGGNEQVIEGGDQ